MLAGASAAPIAQGPVIPHYERASDCIRENGQFCFSWFVDNFDRVCVPRVVELIWLTALALGLLVWAALAIAAGTRSGDRQAMGGAGFGIKQRPIDAGRLNLLHFLPAVLVGRPWLMKA